MLLGVSLLLYGVGDGSRRRRTWMVILGTGLALVVRPHIAAVALTALAISRMVEGRRGIKTTRSGRGLLVLALLVAVVLPLASSSIAKRVPGAGVDETVETLGERTSAGGSAFQRPALTSPVGLITAVPYAYFRPTVLEARSVPVAISSLESLLLTMLFIVGIATRRPVPWLRGVLGSMSHRYCLVMTVIGGFMLGVIGNFGLLVRQRVLFELSLLFLVLVRPRIRTSLVSSTEPTAAETPNHAAARRR